VKRALASKWALGLALIGWLTGCGGGGPPAPSTSDAPVAVSSVPVQRESLVEPVLGTGTIAAQKTTHVGPRVSGIIEAIHVAVGDRVEAGAPLFTTRPVEYRIAVQEALHALRLARAEADKARRDVRRIEQLRAQNVASSERLDEARTAFEIADARRGAAETALERAQQDLENTVVRAPYTAVVTRRHVDEGTMMTTLMSSASLVVEIMKIDVVEAILQIPEVDLARIRIGTRARLRIDGTQGEVEGAVGVLNDRVDPLSRSFEVRIQVANQDYAIKPGLFVRAELRPEPREALVLERRALLGPGNARFVWVDSGGRARRREVRVRELDATRVEVIEGLAAGERALAGPNLPRLTEGTPIAVELARADR
jgi:RND family efflux transporter MFP subunit